MKKYYIAFFFGLVFSGTFAQDWSIAGTRIKSQWAEQVDPKNPLPDYPRPHLQRSAWTNLNGLWQYAILPLEESGQRPAAFQGQILVPFAVESALSGVGRTVGKDSVLWYRRELNLHPDRSGKFLLHFGAVDWRAEVFVNGQPVGTHEGGFDPFSFDISRFLNKNGKQEILVKVWDPTDDGPQPRGKQIKNPHGIWYTPVTGIWQTVWLEKLPQTYIVSSRHTPDIDKGLVEISVKVESASAEDRVRITVRDGQHLIAEKEVEPNKPVLIPVQEAKLWSPSNPFLYDLSFSVIRNSKVIDKADSYFAMRKISMAPDVNGVQRMLLNNEFLFQYGPLDQGWWPDGLYTAPTDEALKFDIDKTKEMGFNMIRKHVKVEPARWYYHCDREGMLVWQDMPSGDLGNPWEMRPFILGKQADRERTKESEQLFLKEWFAIMDAFHNFPSIIAWVPFNEAWGQFKTEEVVAKTLEKDSSRLINSASGGNFYFAGHMVDYHHYPEPLIPDPRMFGREMVVVLGEFGGLGLPVPDHTWQQRNWGYQSFGTSDSLRMRYEAFARKIEEFIPIGLSAAVYTQTTDVEGETNGIMTYDRKVIKIPVDRLREMHQRFYNRSLVKVKPD